MIRDILKFLAVIQQRGEPKKRRINPYNPLSYITIVIVFISGLIMFGAVGIWKEIDLSNPFKWR
jgi:thiosulfate reductase cytochrome b subunit